MVGPTYSPSAVSLPEVAASHHSSEANMVGRVSRSPEAHSPPIVHRPNFSTTSSIRPTFFSTSLTSAMPSTSTGAKTIINNTVSQSSIPITTSSLSTTSISLSPSSLLSKPNLTSDNLCSNSEVDLRRASSSCINYLSETGSSRLWPGEPVADPKVEEATVTDTCHAGVRRFSLTCGSLTPMGLEPSGLSSPFVDSPFISPEPLQGTLSKRRKWPMKGWHKKGVQYTGEASPVH
ncbi:unnamed protein product [Protopolystoma xenopodis]|uniref:Uncharacterized protein n=1 Tax=Protopolystoma xenopodis TaxID=117903 RepID=A0A448WKS6_9PLAT|nr:unnamed protein product [Protopolystoma xenopodis]